jgi:hypothetical protein
MPVLDLFCLLVCWILLPLVPAVLIYTLFPNTPVAASGPLAGLTIKTGGAFAAYLIIVVVVFPLINTIKDQIGGSIRPSWEIRGEVKLVDQNGSEILNRDLLEAMRLSSNPKCLNHSAEMLILTVAQDPIGRNLPKVVVEIPGWGSKDIDLNRQPITSNFEHLINIGQIEIPQMPTALVYNSRSGMDK